MDQALKDGETKAKAAREKAYEKTRRSLIERLENWEDQRSWDEFYQTYWRLVYAFASRAGLRDDECWDVVQETIISLARQSHGKGGYDPDKGSSFKSWLLTIARWRVADQFKIRNKLPAASPEQRRNDDDGPEGSHRQTATLDRLEDPDGVPLEAVWDAEWNSQITSIALKNVRENISPKQFQIFDCYVVKGWDVPKVTRELGVSAAQVYVVKHRVGRLVKKEITRLENEIL